MLDIIDTVSDFAWDEYVASHCVCLEACGQRLGGRGEASFQRGWQVHGDGVRGVWWVMGKGERGIGGEELFMLLWYTSRPPELYLSSMAFTVA